MTDDNKQPAATAVIGRRDLLATLSGLLAGVAASVPAALAMPVTPSDGAVKLRGAVLRFADLTHQLTTAFNFNPLQPRIVMDPVVGSGYAAGMNMNRVLLIEHTGTHLDAPRHFDTKGASVGDIPLKDLIVPLAVVDISARLSDVEEPALEVKDIEAWEKANGRLPEGCCVAVHSGWDIGEVARYMKNPQGGRMRSPGISVAAATMLINERNVKGVAVDTMSIDTGANSPEYPVHQLWLRSGRWGIEGVTNLKTIPASGAVLVAGIAPIAQATGFPVRAIALY